MTYHFDGFDFKHSGGVQAYDYYLNDNGDGFDSNTNIRSFTLLDVVPGGTPLTVFPEVLANYVEDDWWTAHDFSLQSTSDSAFQWTGGIFYHFQATTISRTRFPIRCSRSLRTRSASSPLPASAVRTAAPGAAASQPGSITSATSSTSSMSRPFRPTARRSYKLNDEFKITADLRYTSDQEERHRRTRAYVSFLAAQQTAINPATGAACPAGAAPGTCFPTYALAGVNTPAVDVTDSRDLLERHADGRRRGHGQPHQPRAAAGMTLARGVRSAAVIEANAATPTGSSASTPAPSPAASTWTGSRPRTSSPTSATAVATSRRRSTPARWWPTRLRTSEWPERLRDRLQADLRPRAADRHRRILLRL